MAKNKSDLNLKEQLEESIRKYGYKPSPTQSGVLISLSMGKNVFVGRVLPEWASIDVNWQNRHYRHRAYEQGRIATYCVGILNQLNISSESQCQCIIITRDTNYAGEVVDDMKSLGVRDLGVQVKPMWEVNESSPTFAGFPHVAIGPISQVKPFLSQNKNLWTSEIKMLVFDWGEELSLSGEEQHLLTANILNLLKLEQTQVQIAVFSQTKEPMEVWRFHLGVQFDTFNEDSIRRCTLEGIMKHKLVQIDDSVDKEPKVSILYAMIGRRKLSECTRTIIVVGTYGKLYNLTKALEKLGIKFAAARMGMNQKDRDRMLMEFLDEHYLLITTTIGHLDMASEFFDSSVYSIVYYDCRIFDKYTQYLGWFKNVGAAITLATLEDMNMLLKIQKDYHLNFERMEPSGYIHSRCGAKKHMKFEGENHYTLQVGSDYNRMGARLTCSRNFLCEILIVAGGISVIFVQHAQDVEIVVEEMQEMFALYEQKLFVTGNILKAEEEGSNGVFVASDDAIDEEFDSLVERIKGKIHVVINYDMPDHKDVYHHRFGCCHSSRIIFHCATPSDWSKLFDIQVGLIMPFKLSNFADITNHLKRTGGGGEFPAAQNL